MVGELVAIDTTEAAIAARFLVRTVVAFTLVLASLFAGPLMLQPTHLLDFYMILEYKKHYM